MRNLFIARWNILFDKEQTQWISFEPELGKHVYPCYACRHMFSAKTSFIDHINRRSILLRYKCKSCPQNDGALTFYNPCAFLMHARKHFSLKKGKIDLADVETNLLPVGLAGFLPHPDIPILYDDAEEDAPSNVYVNTKFYSPNRRQLGQQVITVYATELTFQRLSLISGSPVVLMLKQISANVPHCVFIKYEMHRPVPEDPFEFNEINSESSSSTGTTAQNNNINILIKEEPIEIDECDAADKLDATINENQDTNDSDENYPSCPECGLVQRIPMTEHFLRENQPLDEELCCPECKFIATSKCSLSAHIRIHTTETPFICPECGKDFDNINSLFAHLDEVCFHLYKQVKFRCPGKKCGKLFAQTNTFMTHLVIHMECLNKCIVCCAAFFSKEDFYEHVKTHEGYDTPVLIYKCNICKGKETFTESNYEGHVMWHVKNRKSYTYVYICRRCRSYFRSKQTYAVHLLRCTKPISNSSNLNFFKRDSGGGAVNKEDGSNHAVQGKKPAGERFCSNCKVKFNFRQEEAPRHCPRCGGLLTKKKPAKKPPALIPIHDRGGVNCAKQTDDSCVLSDDKIETNNKDHVLKEPCRFQSPVVVLDPVEVDPLLFDEVKIEIEPPDSDNDCGINDESPTPSEQPLEIESPKSDQSTLSAKKKRRKSLTLAKIKKPCLELEPQALPMPFDGTYRCTVCAYTSEERETFQSHVINHRDVSTSYQCMECGECFVVKPSLIKHLTYFHSILDPDEYLEKNSCFDKVAVKELEEHMKMIPIKFTNEPLDENQCIVCKEQFKDDVELKKHTRMHGMAFLLQNSK